MTPLKLPELDTRSFMTLENRQMLNDTIVEYYMIRCLMTRPDKQQQFHLFNTFFYKKLIETVKYKPRDLENLTRTWDRNVKLFDKDYLVIPVCTHRHWLLVIICSPAKVPPQDDPICPIGAMKLEEQPCIILFDSLRFKYMSKFIDPFREFLQSRWKYERPNETSRAFINQIAFRHYHANVPYQRNHFDCGIFMLYFFEKFLNSPLSCIYRVTRHKELKDRWLVDAADMRNRIKVMIKNSNQSLTISQESDR